MTKETFWKLIESSRPADGFAAQVERLQGLLSALPREEVEEFDHLFREYMAMADRRKIRSLAKELGAGFADDAFMDFRSWLISRGRTAFRAAFKDPEQLRDIANDSEDVEFEEFQSVAGRILDE